jgi:hypothetical protein
MRSSGHILLSLLRISGVVQIEQFGCKDVEKMVGVLAVLLYSLLNSCVIVFVK